MRFAAPCGWGLLAVFAAAAAAVIVGDVDDAVDATAAFEVWGDVVRDVDQCGLSLVGVSEAEEMRIGRELAAAGWWADAPESAWQPYVTAVGNRVAAHVRRPGIEYRFHVLDSANVNAFALPGGHVYLTTGMLEFLESEAELASIIGHEIAHVDQRHAIEMLAMRIATERIGLGDLMAVADLPLMLTRAGYRKHQELEADLVGLRLAGAAGYDQQAATAPLRRLAESQQSRMRLSRRDPIAEAAGAVLRGVGSYFDSHPVTEDRIKRLDQLIAGRRWWHRSNSAYRGVENHRRKLPRTMQEFPDEFTPTPAAAANGIE